MPSEILVYGFFHDFSAERFINAMDELESEDEASVRLSSDGGDPEASYGMIAKYKEHPGVKTLKIDAKAKSTAAFFAAAADEVECLNVTSFLFHRAHFQRWFEDDPELMNADARDRLAKINGELRTILESKVDVPRFEEITGHTMDEIFSMDGVLDVVLNADQAMDVGLVDNVVNITGEIRAQISKLGMDYSIAAYSGGVGSKPVKKPKQKKSKQENNDKMDINELKSKHPELYASVVSVGVSQERDRVKAFMTYAGVDVKAVVEGIDGGENPSQEFFAKMNLKAAQASFSTTLEDEAEGGLNPEKPLSPEAKAEKEKEDFLKEAKGSSIHLN